MPRLVCHQEHLQIPEGIQIQVKSGLVTVTGPRGSIERDFAHLCLDFEYHPEEHQVIARCWFGNRKHLARVGTLFGHIKNMIEGVTHGYRYKMRFVSSHFPIKHMIEDNGRKFSFTSFMGQKERKGIHTPETVKIMDSPAQKEEIWIEGNNLDEVSLAAAQIHQLTKIHNKDLRKFLDGIYVSERTQIQE